MKYFVFQGNDHDCGFASLKMYLATLAKDRSYLYIPKPKKREKYNLNEIARISKEYGIPLECYGCSKESYIELDNPCLTLIDENHVVMVKKQNSKRIVLYDPDKGIVRMKKDEFMRRWRCVVLTTNDPECANKIEKIRLNITPPKYKFLEFTTSLISSAILVSTFYLLNKSENYIYSLVFLGMFLVFQIIEKMILYKQVYTFDKTYIPNYFSLQRNCNKEKYSQFINYKTLFFTHRRTLLASILTALLITFLLCLNEFKNVFVLLALILIKLVEKILVSRKEQDSKNIIAELENKSFNDLELTEEYVLKANLKADNHIFYNSVKEIFYICVSFLFALIMMFATNNTGCNFVIFHFVMYFAGFSSYNQIIEHLSNRKEIRRQEARFFDLCNL